MGAISLPCCIRLARVNQNEFRKLNWLIRNSGLPMHGLGFLHSAGQSLPMTNSMRETPKKDAPSKNQTSWEKGLVKEKKLGGSFSGFLYKMLIP